MWLPKRKEEKITSSFVWILFVKGARTSIFLCPSRIASTNIYTSEGKWTDKNYELT